VYVCTFRSPSGSCRVLDLVVALERLHLLEILSGLIVFREVRMETIPVPWIFSICIKSVMLFWKRLEWGDVTRKRRKDFSLLGCVERGNAGCLG